MKNSLITILAALFVLLPGASALTPPLQDRLAGAGANRTEWQKAITLVPDAQRTALEFLIENMPEVDLKTLTSGYLLENVALAYEAFNAAPWAGKVPYDVFLNDILPYASLNEPRDDWRRKLREISAPIIKECKSPGQAAQALNRQLFGLVKVRYSTQRKKPDQSALESMASGVATCSGLSILLVDACRSVGIPARVAGTPMWMNLRGNHTWVEVWDGGWHFCGAAEPDPGGLDRGWFTGDASKARRDIPEHAIYASSFKQTGLSFPLVWDPALDWVPAVNVTDRYAPAVAAAPEDRVRLLVRVLGENKRRAAKVTVADSADATQRLEGISSDESADLNHILLSASAKSQLQARDRTRGKDDRTRGHDDRRSPGRADDHDRAAGVAGGQVQTAWSGAAARYQSASSSATIRTSHFNGAATVVPHASVSGRSVKLHRRPVPGSSAELVHSIRPWFHRSTEKDCKCAVIPIPSAFKSASFRVQIR